MDVHSGETHEEMIKAKYGDQIPPDVEPVTVSWMPQEGIGSSKIFRSIVAVPSLY